MSDLQKIRVKVPRKEIIDTGKVKKYFDILDNSQNLTEEFLYAHQPTTKDTVNVYSTSPTPIGKLDREGVANQFKIIKGPAIIVARKGYAGRLFVVKDEVFIVHEDAYPVKPKQEYSKKINLSWFAGHYSFEFQADRTSFWGIGDFPRTRFKNQIVVIPKITFQKRIALLYIKRNDLLVSIDNYKVDFHNQIDGHIKHLL